MKKGRLKFYQDSMLAYLAADLDDYLCDGNFDQAKRLLKEDCREYYEIADKLREDYEIILKLLGIVKGGK